MGENTAINKIGKEHKSTVSALALHNKLK